MKLRSAGLLVLASFLVCASLLSCSVIQSNAAEPTLVDILNNLGFTNISASSLETFAAGTYNITMYAEFAGWHDTNELSYYQVGTNVFNVIFTGPEGGYEYVVPPLNKSFTANYQFGFSLLSEGTYRYFTELNRNEYNLQHAKVYENLDAPGMFLIGFENQYGWSGDRDYNDMVFSIKPYTPPVEYHLAIETDPPTLVTITGEGWYSDGTNVSLTAPQFVPVSGIRYRFDYWDVDGTPKGTGVNPIIVQMDVNHTATVHCIAQYYLSVVSPYGVPGGEGWYDSGSNAYATLNTGAIDHGNGTRRLFTSWGGDASGANYATSNPIYIDQNKTAMANWKTQYYLTMSTNFGTVGPGDGWHDAGSIFSINATPPTAISGEQYVWNGWTGTGSGSYSGLDNPASITMNGPITETASWTHQYYLTVTSLYDTPGGEGWYDSGSTAYATLSTGTVDHGNGTRRVFTSWDGDASGTDYAQSNPILMDGPKTAIAGWKTQYYLTLTTTAGGVTSPLSSGWYDAGTIAPVTAIPDIDYVFDHWELDSVNVGSTNPYSVTMNTAHTLHAVFVYSSPPPTTYYLTVETNPLGITTISGEGWYDENEDVPLTALNYIDVSSGTRYKFSYWDIDGTPQGTGVNSIIVHMDTNHTATAYYILQYYLTVKTHPSGIASIPGQGWYDSSTSVPLTAPSVSGYIFLYWDVDGVPQGTGVSAISVNMNSYHTATANYERESPIVGGSTVSIKSPLLHTWIGLNVMFISAIFMVASWMKKRRRKD